ncbi:MAG: AraC family transcriptional regulator [Leptospirales bacterium]
MGLLSLIESMYYSGALTHAPWLLGSSPMITSITFAVFGVNLVLMSEDNAKWKKRARLFFVYPFVEVGLYVLYMAKNYGEISEIYDSLHQMDKPVFFPYQLSYYMEFGAGVITYIGVIVFSIITFNPAGKEKIKKKLLVTMAVLITLSALLLIMHIYNFFIFGFGNHNAIYNKFPLFLVIWIAFIYFQVWPFYFKSGAIYFEVNTFGIAEGLGRYLDREHTKKIREALKELIEKDKIYLEEDIHLSSLSKAVGVNSHQMSEYLNKHENVNFSHYINNLRIKDAMELLTAHKKSIAEICYEIGFNTPATFYKAFKSVTSMTPKEWRNKNIKSL